MGASLPVSTINKNTVVGLSLGSILAGVVVIWTMLGIGRPLFASDLAQINQSIGALDTKTSVAFLNISKQGLKTELRQAKRELRENPDDGGLEDDIDDIEGDIKDIEEKIKCHRTADCEVEEI